MKKQDLIKMIEQLPDDAEILIMHSDEIMGYYDYEDPYIEEATVYKGKTKKGHTAYTATFSNWRPDNYEEVRIYIIGNI